MTPRAVVSTFLKILNWVTVQQIPARAPRGRLFTVSLTLQRGTKPPLPVAEIRLFEPMNLVEKVPNCCHVQGLGAIANTDE